MPNQIEIPGHHLRSPRFLTLGLLLALILFCFTQLAIAQDSKINFVHHTVEDGLSQSSVLSIAQDSLGFMWFGTKDGLNKFNTQTFEIFKHKKNDPASLSSSQNINALITDHKGNVWAGTQNGLNLYLRESNSFKHFLIRTANGTKLTSNVIRSLFEDRQGNIWVGTDYGLYRLLKNGNFEKIEGKTTGGKIFRQQLIRCIYQDHEGAIWIGAVEGLTKITRQKDGFIFASFVHETETPGSLPDNDITSVIEDRQHNLWVATHQFGLTLFNREKGSFTSVSPGGAGKPTDNGRVIRKLMLDNDGRIWIGMLNGIQLFDPLKKDFILLKHDPYIPTSLNQNSIYDIHKDASGSVWVGTYYGGINVYHADAMPFRGYKSFLDKNSISSNVVSAIVEDDRHNLWIGTEAEGLNYYNRTSGLFTSFKSDAGKPDALSSNLVKAIAIDERKRVWIGTYEGGLDLFLPGTNTFKHYSLNNDDPIELNSRRITSLLFDKKKRLWAGTRANSLYLYNADKDVFISCGQMLSPKNNPILHIRHLFEDVNGNIWAATNGGTYRLEKDGAKFAKVMLADKSIPLDDINVIRDDSKGNIWLGSYGAGLIRYHPGTRSSISFTTSNGLPSDVILGILEDNNGALWISTDNGLSKFDGLFFKNYTVKDGLPGNVFNYNSFIKDSRGELYFGGFNGLLSFYPEQIKDNTKPPRAVFTNLRLFNKEVRIADDTHLLSRNINVIGELTFSHSQNIFSIDFAVLNYIKPEKNRYAYKLEGFERDWNYVQAASATFTNLPPGSYTLLIRGTNNDGVWSKEEKLTIHIRPPFWATWWAYIIYVLLFAALLFFILRFIWMRAIMKREQEVHQMKLDFFTNVSHEIRTPLTLITGPLETLIAESQEFPVLHRKLLSLKRNTGRLTRLVTELMDFRKAEAGKMTLNVSPGNIVNFCREIFLSFSHLAIRHHIDYSFVSEERRIEVYFDKFQLEKVIFNLLSNAFKFTPDYGMIKVSVTHFDDGRVSVVVADNGIGIAPENQAQLFTNFYQVKEPGARHNGTGIGLALSKKIAQFHHGDLLLMPLAKEEEKHTRFCLRMRLGSSHFKTEELITPYLNTDNVSLYHDYTAAEPLEQSVLPAGKTDVDILIVEDNEEVREFIRQSLVHRYHIIEAANGAEGLKLATERIPDLIVSDVMMPEMDGLELCRRLKTDERTNHIPVILLTARSGNIHEVNGLKTGADVYLTKPFGVAVLQLTIANLISLKSNIRRKFSQQITLQPANILIESSGEEFLNKLMNLVETNLINDDFTVSILAAEIGMSTPVLYKKIKALTGMTVNNFIKSVRLKRAAQLLKQNHNTVYEVAYLVGFNDSKYFSKEFSRQFGQTPSEYVLSR